MGVPRLSIGLPVYNGEKYLAASLDALLGQTFSDFELIISDNASTDATAEICAAYAARDGRIRYVRQTHNTGAGPNHNAVLALARGEYFAWASHDDLYHRDLMRLCVEALDERPEISLAHAWDSEVDETGSVLKTDPYVFRTDDPRPWVRLWSLLVTSGGNDFYGVFRTETVRRVGGLGSYYNADRVFVAAMALQGAFYQVPEVLYFRRDHPERASRRPTHHAKAIAYDPRLEHRSMLRIYLSYLAGFVSALVSAPLSPYARGRCWLEFARWLTWKGVPLRRRHATPAPASTSGGGTGAAATRITAVGYFGVGNFGNEATFDVFQDWLTTSHPSARLEVVGIDPGVIRRERGLPASRLMLYRRDLEASSAGITVLKAVCRAIDVPRMFRVAARSDLVVVPGSGTLESSLGLRPWGLPLWLASLALACRMQRKPFVLLCVGAEYAKDPVTRFFHRWTTRLAHSVSVRDERSRQAIHSLGVRRQDIRIGADLVFAQASQVLAPPEAARVADRVAVGVMAYYGGPSSPERGPAVLERYERAMTRFIRGLIERGLQVTVLIGDPGDRPVAESIVASVADPRASVSSACDQDGLTAELVTVGAVVASRFHNIVGALRTRRPTVSVGYARKNADLLARFGLEDTAQSLDSVDDAELLVQLDRALKQADDAVMEAALRDQRDAVLARLDELGTVIAASARG